MTVPGRRGRPPRPRWPGVATAESHPGPCPFTPDPEWFRELAELDQGAAAAPEEGTTGETEG